MWIGKQVAAQIEAMRVENAEMFGRLSAAHMEVTKLREENARLESRLTWFMTRLNHTEKERAQLIHAAIGVKTSVPEFVPTPHRPDEALHEMVDFTNVGEDAKDDGSAAQEVPVDYSMMPRFGKR